MRRRNHADRLAFVDVATAQESAFPPGYDRERLMAVLHGMTPDGQVLVRLAAVRMAYCALGLGWVTAWTAWPGLAWLAERAYSVFARNRIRLGAMLGGRCGEGSCGVGGSALADHAQRKG